MINKTQPFLFEPDFQASTDGRVIPGSQTYFTQVTLRDIFAGQAMQQIMILRGPVVFNTILAELSYDIADAMIAEREKR